MIEGIKHFFRKPTMLEVANRELAEAELELLGAEKSFETSDALVTIYVGRIQRLKSHISALKESTK